MYFVLSDIHGCHAELVKALTHWNPAKETLIVMGDLVDRGPDSLNVIRELMKQKAAHPDRVIVLKGNHDLDWLDWALHSDPKDMNFYYVESQHAATVKSFLNSDTARDANPENFPFDRAEPRAFGQFIRRHFHAELAFLNSGELFHEEDHCIFVHAGINLELENWWMDTRAMTSIRNKFIHSKRISDKRIFFGHTTTRNMHPGRGSDDIWMSNHGDKVGIDGGCSFGDQLNAVRVGKNGLVSETIVIHATSMPKNKNKPKLGVVSHG